METERRWCVRIAHKERVELCIDKTQTGLATVRDLSHSGVFVDQHPLLTSTPVGKIVIVSFCFIPSLHTSIHIPCVLVRKTDSGAGLMFLKRSPHVARCLEKVFESDGLIRSIREQAQKKPATKGRRTVVPALRLIAVA
jgi:hypothetical protein